MEEQRIIYDRILEEAWYIILTKATVRQAAKRFKISKSTIHKDMSERLKTINKDYYDEVKKIMRYNFSQKHIRGGQATRKKYKK